MQKQIYLQTERTFMRNLESDDAEGFYTLNRNKAVLKYTGDVPFENIQAAKDFLSQYDQYEKYGAGRLAVIEKSTSKFIGWCGIKYHPHNNVYDIGFRFFKEYRNMGFATETAKRCLDFGLKDLGIQQIIGRAITENKASIKVLEKIGMTNKENFDFEGHHGVIYEIINTSWKSPKH